MRSPPLKKCVSNSIHVYRQACKNHESFQEFFAQAVKTARQKYHRAGNICMLKRVAIMLNAGLEDLVQNAGEVAGDAVVGNRMWNVVPAPTVLSTVMVASWSSTNCLTIESPNPNPSVPISGLRCA